MPAKASASRSPASGTCTAGPTKPAWMACRTPTGNLPPTRHVPPCYASPLMRRIPAALAAALLLLSTGCGYVGGPLTPLANVPAKVTDLAAVQRGSLLVVHFTVPPLTTEKRTIDKPLQFDLRIGSTPQPFNSAQWLDHAKPLTGGRVDRKSTRLNSSHLGI